MRSLKESVVAAIDDKVMQNTIDYWKPIRSRTLFHETYHWKKTVSEPKCVDITYVPRAIVKLGVSSPEDAAINAESYALAAMAIYLQQTFKLASPPKPQSRANGASEDQVTIAGAEIVEHHLDSPPDWWEAPVAITNKTFEPDMTDTVRMSNVGALSSSGPFDACVEGLYGDMKQCNYWCGEESASCTKSPTNSTVICSGCVARPATPVCKEGRYSNIDTCYAQCTGGLCFENAGEDGIQCQDCPP
ncbi:hypothetical protein N7475_007745 [Penicillium sp. IBT 31633x]|nr:hypothetical protein N7475_007745 [Penicillium sp. IBT 31633x]